MLANAFRGFPITKLLLETCFRNACFNSTEAQEEICEGLPGLELKLGINRFGLVQSLAQALIQNSASSKRLCRRDP